MTQFSKISINWQILERREWLKFFGKTSLLRSSIWNLEALQTKFKRMEVFLKKLKISINSLLISPKIFANHPKILTNHQKIEFSISLHLSRRSTLLFYKRRCEFLPRHVSYIFQHNNLDSNIFPTSVPYSSINFQVNLDRRCTPKCDWWPQSLSNVL